MSRISFKKISYFEVYDGNIPYIHHSTEKTMRLARMVLNSNILELESLSELKDAKFVFEVILRGDTCQNGDIYIRSKNDIPICTYEEYMDVYNYCLKEYSIRVFLETASVVRGV